MQSPPPPIIYIKILNSGVTDAKWMEDVTKYNLTKDMRERTENVNI